jgi:glyoxalase/bleomycin resistance protein/dioxygenase superfamily protein
MTRGLRFHHCGVAVEDVSKALAYYQGVLGLERASEVVDDENLRVRVCLLRLSAHHRDAYIELVGPLGPDSPIEGILKRGMSYYHICYATPDLAGAASFLRSHRALQVVPPTPAKLFAGRRITFLMTRETGLIELLEDELVALPSPSSETE